jgi:hypothetical protein
LSTEESTYHEVVGYLCIALFDFAVYQQLGLDCCPEDSNIFAAIIEVRVYLMVAALCFLVFVFLFVFLFVQSDISSLT